MKKKLYSNTLLLAGLVTLPLSSVANDNGQLSGFISVGAVKSSEPNIALSNFGIEESTSYSADSVLGLQYDFLLDERSKVSAQILARETSDNFQLEAEWLYVSHRLNNGISFRAGRLRIPLYLHSEYYYVAQSFPWVRLPTEVYSIPLSITQYNGVEVLYDVNVMNADITLRALTGKLESEPSYAGAPANLEAEQINGFVLDYQYEDLKVHASYVNVKIVASTSLLPGVDIFAHGKLTSLGANYSVGDFEFNAEYGGIDSEIESTLFNYDDTDAYGWYISGAYDTDYATPYFTFGGAQTEGGFGETKVESNSTTLGIRFDLSLRSSVKVEFSRGEFIDPLMTFLLPPTADQEEKISVMGVTYNATF